MARKLSIFLFVAALIFFTFSPGNELHIDAITVNGVPVENPVYTGASTMERPQFTPVPKPTPTPTPLPTPTPTPGPTPTPTPIPTPSPTPLVSGMRGQEITDLQESLIAYGFLEGKADGVYGKGTISAINNAKAYLNDQHAAANPPSADTVSYFEGGADMAGAMPDIQKPLFILDGKADHDLVEMLHSDDFFDDYVVLNEGDKGSAVRRLQSRLNSLNYIYKGVDGAFGKTTRDALIAFQKENALPTTGIADKNTQMMLFSLSAKRSEKPLHEYKVIVDISEQRVYVYQWKNGDYSKLVKKMKCSTGASGTPTPTGNYSETVRRGEKWHYFKDFGCWAQNAIHIDPTGNIMFHSVIYNKRGGRPTSGSVSALGRRASHGCIRLAVDNSKWMHEHITDGTNVIIRK